MKNWERAVIYTAIILLFIGVGSLYETDLQCHYGLIVGTLTALVTILVGWNIYSTIELRHIKDDINKELNYAHNKLDYYQALHYGFEAQTLALSITDVPKSDIKVLMLHKGLVAIKNLSCLGEFDNCESITSTLVEALIYTKNISINNPDELLILIGEIPNRNKIKSLPKLINAIETIKYYRAKG